jgi:hypothetical protein
MPPKKAIPDPLKDGSPGEEATPAKESTKEFVSIEVTAPVQLSLDEFLTNGTNFRITACQRA